jgi:hypothetical protein
VVFYWFIIFFTQFFKLNIKFEAKYDKEHDKIQIFLHQTLHYSKIYNFSLNLDHKFKTIIMLKDIRVSKSKRIYVFFLGMFWTHGSFLVKYIEVHQKIETIWWTFDKEKGLLKQKTTCSHVFLECFKNIKGFLKHGEFSNFQKTILKDYPHTTWLLFSYFHRWSNFFWGGYDDVAHYSMSY